MLFFFWWSWSGLYFRYYSCVILSSLPYMFILKTFICIFQFVFPCVMHAIYFLFIHVSSVGRNGDYELDSKLEDLNLDVRKNSVDIERRSLTGSYFGRYFSRSYYHLHLSIICNFLCRLLFVFFLVKTISCLSSNQTIDI